ncbi:hypothetical protein FVA74_04510 [Salinibacterium sp. dk2585]|uniref:HAAS signaling domain-containing protein n=1 Tax=unclassified Salinibacterium TaxID=2632331 RepID=UPI0011C249E3|nr:MULTISPECIES: hypothetical protein [unclassified Salinibacterium]QEE60925.1 hypothetical protein FVA74_04510 [Salinibacterium sp. dk2585]TXK55996.1 hypothetical protein FVP63_04655 [Salinibacterium sp. dk5596]
MTQNSRPQVVSNYLAQLDVELRGVPGGVAAEIRAGIEEELTGLDAATAAERIEQLGDPAFIAAEAQSEFFVEDAAAASPETASKPLAIVAGLALAIGGFVVPVVGWIAGVVLVLLSDAWRIGEKLLATLLVPVLVVLGIAVSIALWRAEPVIGDNISLVLGPVDPILIGFVLPAVAYLFLGIWLLVRAHRRDYASQARRGARG